MSNDRETIERLERENEELTSKFINLKEKLTDLDANYQKALSDNGAAMNLVKQLQATRDQLKREKEEARKEANFASGQNIKLKQTVDGLHNAIRLSKKGIDSYSLGDEVLTEDGTKARISSIFIDRGGVKYYIVYWLQGRRVEVRVDHQEVTLVDDLLSLPEDPAIPKEVSRQPDLAHMFPKGRST